MYVFMYVCLYACMYMLHMCNVYEGQKRPDGSGVTTEGIVCPWIRVSKTWVSLSSNVCAKHKACLHILLYLFPLENVLSAKVNNSILIRNSIYSRK